MFLLLSGQAYRKVASSPQKGPEYHGPCPVCGGDDRFHIWPEQDGGTFWCRSCGKQGDLIEFYRWRDGLSYRDACAKAGVSPQVYLPQSAPSAPRRAAAPFAPAASAPVDQIWAEHATKFALQCNEQLMANRSQQEWLARRGINSAMIVKYTLGWNPKDAYRPRASWGLPEQRRTDGRPKKLWIPLGLVIPNWIDERVTRLRIRRPNPEQGQAKYYVVPGSDHEPLISSMEKNAYVLVESELDAIVLDAVAGDIVGVIAMGSALAKPTAACHALLSAAIHLSVSLDSDAHFNPVTGKTESPGAQGSIWWLKQYRQAVRVPIIGGKDPGEAFERGVDLRTWVLAGLPPRFHLNVKPATDKGSLSVAEFQSLSQQKPAVSQVITTDNQPSHRILTLTTGQEIHLTDNQELWEQLVADGLIVFSYNELQRLQAALAGLQGNERVQAVQAAVDVKMVFPGAYIRRGEVAV